eukprot:CAMPEP_0116542116 /NCGR_PEP_ID=MMETSP0397-20121206/846_1 /TAXON_ID=216820 /ORGANISM="Cyclophora tenuis, Strain ECT3854" /LENGTH=179 /DNA_ID=CAMNT_0004066107 /DNA_START=121 /DNA_END=660 /DNA_ORIENTATION=+
MATRAVGKKPAAKKVAKKVVKKAAASSDPFVPAAALPINDGYPTLRQSTENWKPWTRISGGGNKAPPKTFNVPDFSDPALQIERDPAFYAAAAKTRTSKGKEVFAYDDGLSVLERKQRVVAPGFLSGSAISQADKSTIRSDLEGEDFAFGLDSDRFQLLFISIFGLFTLVGCLSGSIKL